MASCLRFLQAAMPADRFFLQQYEPGRGVRTIATATAFGGQRVDLLTPLSKEVITDRDRERERGEVVIVKEPESHPIAPAMLKFHGVEVESTSALYMPLWSRDRRLGSVVLVALGRGRFTEEHARLLSLLCEPLSIAMENALEHRKALQNNDALEDDIAHLHRELNRASGAEIVGARFGLAPVMELVRQVASADGPVLLVGERGVGKSVIAAAIHELSLRREQPLVTVNPGPIPPSAVDSELFGHEQGTSTGAGRALSQKRGRLERADGGTVFFEEVTALPLDAQVKLARLLRDKQLQRLGGAEPISVDIRVVAATRHSTEHLQGGLHEDLWIQLSSTTITLPPLRERLSDLPALAHHFVALKARELNLPTLPILSTVDLAALSRYRWPGNVRELCNIVERALILAGPHGGLDLERLVPTKPSEPPFKETESLDLERAMTRHIKRVLRLTGGKIHGSGGAAQLMGLNSSTLRSRMRKLGVPFRRGS